MARELPMAALRSLLLAAAATVYVTAAFAAEVPEAGANQVTGGSVEVESAGAPEAGPAPRHGPPVHELGTREEGRDYTGQLAALVPQRKGLAVIADFSNARLEDWTGPGFSNVDQIKSQLRLMEQHWAWLSRGQESFHWDVVRVTLPVELGPGAYAGWGDYRDAVASLITQAVDASDYDSNRDGNIDTAWVIASSNGCSDCAYIIGGASRHRGVNLFVDGQDSKSVADGATGNFNHETGHTIGLPDLYGTFGTLSYLTVMHDSWANPPNDFTAYERTLLGWVKPQVINRTKRNIRLSPPGDHMQAVRIPGADRSEYFLIEYRRRPVGGFGSATDVAYDGLSVLHVLEGSHQNFDPPLLKLEPADGSVAPATAPTQTDFFYPGNAQMRLPAVLRSYYGNKEVFRLSHLKKVQGGGLAFDIEIAAKGSLPNLLTNSSFETVSGGLPKTWKSQAYEASASFGLDQGVARSGKRSVSITARLPNDAMWHQSVSGLKVNQRYGLCGWLRGNDVEAADSSIGANVSILGGFLHSYGRSGTFDWMESCLFFKAEAASVQVACRLGFFSSTVTGKVWCDDFTLTPLRSAF